MTDSFVISIIGFVINIAQAKLLAQKNGYSIYPDQVYSTMYYYSLVHCLLHDVQTSNFPIIKCHLLRWSGELLLLFCVSVCHYC